MIQYNRTCSHSFLMVWIIEEGRLAPRFLSKPMQNTCCLVEKGLCIHRQIDRHLHVFYTHCIKINIFGFSNSYLNNNSSDAFINNTNLNVVITLLKEILCLIS